MEVSQSITQKSGSNLALAFILLPAEKRRAMCAFYAFCREIDDVADEETIPLNRRREQLSLWREDVNLLYKGDTPKFPVMKELAPVLHAHRIQQVLLDEILDGVEMDLEVSRYQTFQDLDQYCYRVASAVGLVSIEIFGYRHPGTRDYAIALGKALQYTNILRDVGVDAEKGRIYLPLELLSEFGVLEEDLLSAKDSPSFRKMAEVFGQKAVQFYHQAASYLPPEDRPSMVAAESMGLVYWKLLQKIIARNYLILGYPKTRLTKPAKLLCLLQTWWNGFRGKPGSLYGLEK